MTIDHAKNPDDPGFGCDATEITESGGLARGTAGWESFGSYRFVPSSRSKMRGSAGQASKITADGTWRPA
ncbi:MAG: hypothetical protein QOJ71_477, partial [Actinomycetota bacterium]|nr:hypothetical protein [Actinomycetota bacterium]